MVPDFWARAILGNLPHGYGRKPGDEGVHTEAPGLLPKGKAALLVGRGSVRMSMGTVPCYFKFFL